MSKGKLLIKPLNSFKKEAVSIPDDVADQWVNSSKKTSNLELPKNFLSEEFEVESTKTKRLDLIDECRFTIVIPSYLHTRIKKHCVVKSIPMKILLTKILLTEFPER